MAVFQPLGKDGIDVGDVPDLSRSALLIHDMSNDRLKSGGKHPDAGSPDLAIVIQNHVRLLSAAREHAIPVFYSFQAMRDDYLDAPLAANSPNSGSSKHGTWGGQIIDELEPRPDDWLLQKGGGYSAFTGTAFDKWLHRLDVQTIIVAGAGTTSGIESTVRDARERDFRAVVVSDACCGKPEANHDASLSNMLRLRTVHVVTTEELIAILAISEGPDRS